MDHTVGNHSPEDPGWWVPTGDPWIDRVLLCLKGQQEEAVSRLGSSRSNQWDRLLAIKDEALNVRRGLLMSRPPRKVPRRSVVAKFHGLPNDECWKCGTRTTYLERAHIIDRVFGGLDGPQNIALLCWLCHRRQPIFKTGDEDMALEYLGLDKIRRAP